MMTRALNEGSTDLIGLGRPLAAEPRLCIDFLAGNRTAAKANLDDDRISAFAGIMQVQNIGLGQPILDFSDQTVAWHIEGLMRGTSSDAPNNEKAVNA
jgi:hypothetical protein